LRRFKVQGSIVQGELPPLPDLNPDDVDELEQLIRQGRLPVRMQGEFEKDESDNGQRSKAGIRHAATGKR
jgi:hypothetical protein